MSTLNSLDGVIRKTERTWRLRKSTTVMDCPRLFVVISVLVSKLYAMDVGLMPTRKLVKDAKPATEKDYYTEWLAPIVSIRVVKGLDEAIAHIAKYGSQHTDAIVTGDRARADRFLREVDSSSVIVNASTRFADGYRYGFGAEVGISTDKLHARGPMGLESLTTYQWIVEGRGNVRK